MVLCDVRREKQYLNIYLVLVKRHGHCLSLNIVLICKNFSYCCSVYMAVIEQFFALILPRKVLYIYTHDLYYSKIMSMQVIMFCICAYIFCKFMDFLQAIIV